MVLYAVAHFRRLSSHRYMQVVDCIIVGGGLCGRLLQLQLHKEGKSTVVYDSPEVNHCTAVAAGLANPLVGKFFTIGWRADEIFPSLDSFYADIESKLNASFFRPIGFKRIISSAGEQNIWLSKAHKAKYEGFCSFANESIDGLSTGFGVLNVAQGGEMNTQAFLLACDQHLPTVKEDFDYDKLNLAEKKYGELSFEKIVFAEGYKIMNNPLWRDYKMVVPTKGELLTIETDLEPKDNIYLGSVFLQHTEGKTWRVGSTYAQRDSTLNPTAMMRADLVTKLDKVINIPYNITDHYCGVRPASIDRKPILGEHPQHKDVYVLNGMGSKAVSLAPLLVAEMADYMYSGGKLHESVDLQRF